MCSRKYNATEYIQKIKYDCSRHQDVYIEVSFVSIFLHGAFTFHQSSFVISDPPKRGTLEKYFSVFFNEQRLRFESCFQTRILGLDFSHEN